MVHQFLYEVNVTPWLDNVPNAQQCDGASLPCWITNGDVTFTMPVLGLSEGCSYGLHSPEIWRHIAEWLVQDILRQWRVLMFKGWNAQQYCMETSPSVLQLWNFL